MKKTDKPLAAKICLWAGISLLVVGVLVLAYWQLPTRFWAQKSESYVETLRTLMPSPQDSIPEERRENAMSVLSLDETDFIGILEMPRYEASLPVCADWECFAKFPCQFAGSIYDGTLQIGATSQIGQYDFYREISVGDLVRFTDVAGNRYTYTITNLRYEKHADSTTLNREDSALTLFIKNVYDFEYLIVFCNAI